MRIAVVCTDSNVVYADPARCPARLRGMAEALARAGHELTLLLAGPQMAVEGVAVREMRLPVTAREIDWHFSQVRPELVIERLVPGRTECTAAARESLVPMLFDVADSPLAAEGAVAALTAVCAEAAAAVPGAGVIVASDEQARVVRAAIGSTLPVDVVEDAVAPELFRVARESVRAQVSTRLRLGVAEKRVGFIGPVTRDSGVLDLVRAISEMDESGRPRIMLIGDGPARNEALRAAVESGVKLTMCGRVTEDELPAHLSACDTVVVSAAGGALPLLQAMAAWRAVIAFDSAEARRVARDGAEARLVLPGKPMALLAALRELDGDPSLRGLLGEAARLRVSRAFTWDAQAARVLELAGALVERSRAV